MKLSYLVFFMVCLSATTWATPADTLGVGQPFAAIQKDSFWLRYELKEQAREACPFQHENVPFVSEKYKNKFSIYTILDKDKKVISGHCKFSKNFIHKEASTFQQVFQDFFKLFSHHLDLVEINPMLQAFGNTRGKVDMQFVRMMDVFRGTTNIATIELFHCVIKVSNNPSDIIEIGIYNKDWKVCSVDGNSNYPSLIFNKLRQKGTLKHPKNTIQLEARPNLDIYTYACYTIEFTTPEQAYHYYQASAFRFAEGTLDEQVKMSDYFTKNMLEYEIQPFAENSAGHRFFYLAFQLERTVICIQIEASQEFNQDDMFEFGYELYQHLPGKK